MKTVLQVLSEDQRAQVHERTLSVLARTGVRVDSARGRAILSDAGAEVNEDTCVVRFPRSLVEEFSGKVFEYTEILPVFEHYIADKKAADVTADTRALADMCLLLFNANEFLYLQ